MNDTVALPPGQRRRGVMRWAEAVASGDWRASAVCFVVLTVFYLLTAAGNLGETDDVYAFAYRAEHFDVTHLSDPRLMLYHVIMRLLFLGATALGLDVSALVMMRGVSALCAAGTLLLMMRILSGDLKLSTATAVLSAALLASCYGFWRYAAEAEVYIPACFLILLVLHGLWGLSPQDDTLRPARGAAVAAGWGALAGLAVLVYQPSVIPLFFAFPLLLARRGGLLPIFGYLAAGGAVVAGGYLIGFLAYWAAPLNSSAFISFLSQRSGEFIVPPLSLRTVVVSMVRAAFALGHDIATANWVFAFDPVADLIQRAFSYNVIAEEIFLAKRAGMLAYFPVVTLLMLVALALRILISLWPLSREEFYRRPVLVLLAWTAINGAIVGRLNPAGVEAWIMLLPPLVLLAAVWIVEPCLRAGRGRLVAGLVVVLFLHNALGGMALVRDPQGEYDRAIGEWVIAEAEPRDLVIVAGNAGRAEALRYLSAAEVALIYSQDRPHLAESLLSGNPARLLTLTRGRDFDRHLLRSLIRKAGEAGGRVILFDDFFKLPPGLGAGDWPQFELVRSLQQKAVPVYSRPGAGTTYVLSAPTE